ncbi:hypothetical protein A4A49_15298 [Nicotiana attenuata]|uniref:Uncharacterized protein n=1 Tax=Nicotiana attenuata TaxID=49451 RepID=A0A314KKP2_NICAT|nr:hypothetical protein A4A49_15298 [Nicotiana attenuata]
MLDGTVVPRSSKELVSNLEDRGTVVKANDQPKKLKLPDYIPATRAFAMIYNAVSKATAGALAGDDRGAAEVPNLEATVALKAAGNRAAAGIANTTADRATNAKNHATDVVVGHEKSGIEAATVCLKLEATVALNATGDRPTVEAPKSTIALVDLVEKLVGEVQKQDNRTGQQAIQSIGAPHLSVCDGDAQFSSDVQATNKGSISKVRPDVGRLLTRMKAQAKNVRIGVCKHGGESKPITGKNSTPSSEKQQQIVKEIGARLQAIVTVDERNVERTQEPTEQQAATGEVFTRKTWANQIEEDEEDYADSLQDDSDDATDQFSSRP